VRFVLNRCPLVVLAVNVNSGGFGLMVAKASSGI
jgi:hypothetical protein